MAKFRLLEFFVLSRLSSQPPFAAVFDGRERFVSHDCVRLFCLMCLFCLVFWFVTLYTRPLSYKVFDCTHTDALSLNHTWCCSVYLLVHTRTFA
jgi:hypothetical protein